MNDNILRAAELFDRGEMTEEEKELFICDFRKVCTEYFETDGKFTLDVAPNGSGYSVCIIFDAHRIKRFKKPR